MCGIAGYIAAEGSLADQALALRMADRLIHRGPDAAGCFCEGRVALAHRRLSIIDVSGGDQPLSNEDGALQIVFNGEIYNFQELRAGLAARGHRFTTRSDTEVLVHLYEDVGERLPEYLNGMFAFAIWDARNRELFLARDRFGEKPLYYSFAVPGTAFCFASELKAFAALPGFRSRIEPSSVADFLALSYVPDPKTIYDGVFKLPPAHSLRVPLDRGSSYKRRYWELRFSSGAARDLAETAEEVRRLAVDSVARRMVSDVPIGAFLSGGVDSSAVVATMAQAAPGRVRTFSIGFTDKRYDELRFARMVSGRYRTRHYEEIVSPSIHEVLDTLVDHFDEPFGDSSAIPTLYLARITRRHVTVALSGDGADELFGGYRRYRFGVLEQRLRARFPGWFERGVLPALAGVFPKFDFLPRFLRAKALLTTLSQEIGDAYFTSLATFGDGALARVLSPDIGGAADGYTPRALFRDRFAEVRHLPPLQQLQAVDVLTWLPGDILVKTDRATMAHSLESRCPWLDHRLAELAATLPAGLKLRGGNGKFVFKEAFRPWLPAPVLDRRKMGFSVPLAAWFRTSLVPVFESNVLAPRMETYVALPEVRRLWTEHRSGLHDHSRKLWNLLMLACWDRRHVAGVPSPGIAAAVSG